MVQVLGEVNFDGYKVAIRLEGVYFCSISKLDPKSNQRFTWGLEDFEVRQSPTKDIQKIKELVNENHKNKQDAMHSFDPAVADHLFDIESFSARFSCLRHWIDNILTLIRDQGPSKVPDWEIALDILLFGGKYRLETVPPAEQSVRGLDSQVVDQNQVPSLSTRVASTKDLLNPVSWLSDISNLGENFSLTAL